MNKTDSDAIKGIAIIMLYMHHLYHSDRWKSYEIVWGGVPSERIISIAVFCRICVAIFVFISAYGISKQYMKFSDKGIDFLWKDALFRFIKLMLSLWTIFIPMLILSAILNVHTFNEVYMISESYPVIMGIKYFLIDLLGLAYFFGTPTYNTNWWYLTLAVIIILILPILNKLYDKMRFFIIPCIIIPVVYLRIISLEFYGITPYGMGIVTALVMSRERTIELFKNKLEQKKKTVVLLLALFILLFLCGFFLRIHNIINTCFIDNIETIIIILSCTILFCFSWTKFIRYLLAVLGKYSSNMFMIHGFIFAYFFEEFTYSFKNIWLILFVLIIDTFVISFLVELAKNKLGYDKVLHIIREKIKS